MSNNAKNNTIARLLAFTAGILVLLPVHAYALDENGNMTAAEFNRWDWEQQQAKKAQTQRRQAHSAPSRRTAESDDDMPVVTNPKKHVSRRQDDDGMPVISNPKKHVSRHQDDDSMPVIPSAPQSPGPRHTSSPVRGPKRVTPTVINDEPTIPDNQTSPQPSASTVKGKPKRLRDVVSDVPQSVPQPIPQAIPTAPAPAPTVASVPTAPSNDQPKVRGAKRLVVSDTTPAPAPAPIEPPVIEQTATPVVEQPAPPTEPTSIPKVRGAKRLVVSDTTPAIETPQPEQTSVPVAPSEQPAVHGPKRLRDVIADLPQVTSALPAATETALTLDSPSCAAGLTAPATGVARTAKFGTDMRKMIAQTSAPVGEEEVEYVEQYNKYEEVVKHQPRPQVQTPAKPQNEFVTKLLHAAKLEAAKSCRSTSHGRVCRAGKPKGMCLQGVRMAFQKAAGQSTGAGWTMNAKDAGKFIKNYGYHKVAIADAKSAPAGSVFIYVKPGAPHYAGHIEIKGNDGFYSDFYARTAINDPRGMHLNRRLQEVWVPN